MNKKVPFCRSSAPQKYGTVRGVQRYRYSGCNRQFLGGERIDNQVLWEGYTEKKQTLKQLARGIDAR